jgi:hypothetical protein
MVYLWDAFDGNHMVGAFVDVEDVEKRQAWELYLPFNCWLPRFAQEHLPLAVMVEDRFNLDILVHALWIGSDKSPSPIAGRHEDLARPFNQLAQAHGSLR